VTANLTTGTATGSATGTDTLVSGESLTGSASSDTLTGDGGANTYLREHGVELVECSDLSSGVDVDYPEA